jgi:hypothetical protein
VKPLGLALVLLVVAAAQGASAAPAPGLEPKTLVTAQGRIVALAQDGAGIAWLEYGREGRCNRIHVRFGNRERLLPAPGAGSETCRWRRLARAGLALGGERVLWTLHQPGSFERDVLFSAGLSDPRERRLETVGHSSKGVGSWLGGIDGDRGTLAYSTVKIDYVDESDCRRGGDCAMRITGGSTRRVVKGGTREIPGAEGAMAMAVGAGRVALVRPTRTSGGGRPFAGPGVPIRILDGVTGRKEGSLHSPVQVKELALSPKWAVALTAGSGRRSIELYNLRTERFLGDSVVDRRASDVSVSANKMIVYRIDRRIMSLDPKGRRRLLTTTPTTPFGLSIEDRRVIWAENSGGTGRIRSLTLPRPGR